MKKKLLLFFVALSALLAVFVARHTSHAPLHPWTDSAYYLSIAKNLSQGRGFSAFNPRAASDEAEIEPSTYYDPGYPALIAGMHLLSRKPLADAALLVNLVCFGASLVLWFLFFMALLSDKRLALLSFLLLLCVPALWSFSREALSESSFMCFLGGFGHALVRARQSGAWRWFVFAGIFAAATVYCRKAGLAFVASSGIILLLFVLIEKNRKLLLNTLLFGLTAGVLYLPWIIRTYSFTGSLFSKPIHNRPVDLLGLDRLAEGLNYFVNDCLNFPKRFENQYYILFSILMLFVAFVVVRQIRQRQKNFVLWWLLASIGLYLSLILATSMTNPFNRTIGYARFFLVLQPFMIAAFVLLAKDLYADLSGRVFRFIVVVAFASLLAAMGLQGAHRNIRMLTYEDKPMINRPFFVLLQQADTTNSICMSNHWQSVVCFAEIPCRQVSGAKDVKKAICCQSSKEKTFFLHLLKPVGVTFSKGLEIWTEILKPLAYEVKAEDDLNILVELKPASRSGCR